MEHLEKGISLREDNGLCTLGYPSENGQIHIRNY